MGCDIHIITEIKKGGKWQYAPEVPKEFNQRDYGLFALLADVRNSFDTHGFKPKGLPEDISAKKFAFESYTESGKRRYYNDKMKVFIDADGKMKELYELSFSTISKEEYILLNKKFNEHRETFNKRYDSLGWREDKGERTYYVRDAETHGGHFENVLFCQFYPTLDDFMADLYEDEWDEEMQEYGRWKIDFDCEDFHSANYLSLKELEDANYDNYFAHKYKMDKDFYDAFVALGGEIPKGMTVTTPEYNSDLISMLREHITPTVLISWPANAEERKDSDLMKGIESMKEIARQYNIDNPEDIRIVFAFDN